MSINIDIHKKGEKGGARNWKGGISIGSASREYSAEHSRKAYHKKKDKTEAELCEKFDISQNWRDNVVFNVNTKTISLKFDSLEEAIKFSKEANWISKTDISSYIPLDKSYQEKKNEAQHKTCIEMGISKKWMEYVCANPLTKKVIIRFKNVEECEFFLTEMHNSK